MHVSRSSSFARFANAAAAAVGHPAAFIVAAVLVVAWLVSGPLFGFSDTWQLFINTGTTIVTFLMVFLIQNSQNRDAHAMQLKLDELIRAIDGAHLALLDLEELSDSELAKVRRRYIELARAAREGMRRGGNDTGTPDVPFDARD
jgi:low affinity Fe/Cu permease